LKLLDQHPTISLINLGIIEISYLPVHLYE